MSSEHLHIISFDVPFPPDYGGVIDIYFKIKSFHEAGIKVHLHCFEYGRERQKELKNICEKVHYYPRKISKTLLLHKLPYIVISRTSDELKRNLLRDNFPILFEGLHTSYYLNAQDFQNRKTIVRTHNVEHLYYENLAKIEKNLFRKSYFTREAAKLKKHESILHKASLIAAISKNDTAHFSSTFKHVHYIPAFHPNEKAESKTGKGNYALYHGKLSVGENNEAALFLVNKVFNDLEIPLIIAGKNPSKELLNAVGRHKHISIKANIEAEEMHALIQNAQINILPTFQATGIKLKLLAALFSGRHCIVNTPMCENTGLEELCAVADTAKEMKEKIKSFFRQEFEQEEIERREKVLSENYSNKKNMEKLIGLIFKG